MHYVKTSTLFFPYNRGKRAREAILWLKAVVKRDLEHKGREIYLME